MALDVEPCQTFFKVPHTLGNLQNNQKPSHTSGHVPEPCYLSNSTSLMVVLWIRLRLHHCCSFLGTCFPKCPCFCLNHSWKTKSVCVCVGGGGGGGEGGGGGGRGGEEKEGERRRGGGGGVGGEGEKTIKIKRRGLVTFGYVQCRQ